MGDVATRVRVKEGGEGREGGIGFLRKERKKERFWYICMRTVRVHLDLNQRLNALKGHQSKILCNKLSVYVISIIILIHLLGSQFFY